MVPAHPILIVINNLPKAGIFTIGQGRPLLGKLPIHIPYPNFSKQARPHNTGSYVPYSLRKCVGSLTFPANQYGEDAGEWAYGFFRPYPRRLEFLSIS